MREWLLEFDNFQMKLNFLFSWSDNFRLNLSTLLVTFQLHVAQFSIYSKNNSQKSDLQRGQSPLNFQISKFVFFLIFNPIPWSYFCANMSKFEAKKSSLVRFFNWIGAFGPHFKLQRFTFTSLWTYLRKCCFFLISEVNKRNQ